MTKILQRYLASHFIGPFLFSTIFFVAFLLVFQLFRLIRIVTYKGVEWTVVAELVGHIAVSFLPMAIPLSTLFATVYTLNKLSEDSEIVAMRSFGLKKSSLFFPFAIIGLIVGGMVFSLNRTLIPHSKTQFKNTIIKLTARGMTTDIKEGQFFTEIPGVTIFAEKVKNKGTYLENIFIRRLQGEKEQVILAQKGVMIKQSMGKLLTPTLRLHLMKGNISTTTEANGTVENIIFEEYDFPVLVGGSLPGFVTKDSMRTNSGLKQIISERKQEIAELEKVNNLSGRDEGRLRNLKKWLKKSQLEYWMRWNTPIQVWIFVLLGFSLGIKKGRGRTRNSGVIGLIVLTVYYIFFFAGVSLARKGAIPPPVAIFGPTFGATFVGAYFFRKIDWFS